MFALGIVTSMQTLFRPAAPDCVFASACGFITLQWGIWGKRCSGSVASTLSFNAFQVCSFPCLAVSLCASRCSQPREGIVWLAPPLLIYLSSDAPTDNCIIYLLKGLWRICHCHTCLSGNRMCHRVASVLPCLMSQMGAGDIRVLDVSCS